MWRPLRPLQLSLFCQLLVLELLLYGARDAGGVRPEYHVHQLPSLLPRTSRKLEGYSGSPIYYNRYFGSIGIKK